MKIKDVVNWWKGAGQPPYVGERWDSADLSICQCGHYPSAHWLIGRCGGWAFPQPFVLWGWHIPVKCRCKWTPDQVREGIGPKVETRTQRRERILREREERGDESAGAGNRSFM